MQSDPPPTAVSSTSRLPPPTRLPPPVLGIRVEVYCPLDWRFYAGTVRKKAEVKTRVVYDDGEEEMVDLNDRGKERCRYIGVMV